MTDPETGAEPADDSAGEADKTDEQVWDDFEGEEKSATPREDDDVGPEPDVDAAPSGDDKTEDPLKPTDDDQIASAAVSDDAADPAGMESEEEKAEKVRLAHALRSEQGRERARQRRASKLQRQLRAADDDPQPPEKDEAALKEQAEKLAAAREEYGDVIGPVLDEVADLRADLGRRDDRDAQAMKQQRDEFEEIVAAEKAVFVKEHPDGFDTINEHRQVFEQWVDDQPRAMRDIYAENQQAIVDGTAASLLVGKFKDALLDAEGSPAPANEETEKLQNKRQRQLAGAQSIRNTKSQKSSSRPAADSDDLQAHWDDFALRDKRANT